MRRDIAHLMLHNTAIPLTTTIRFDIDTSVISTYYSFKRGVRKREHYPNALIGDYYENL